MSALCIQKRLLPTLGTVEYIWNFKCAVTMTDHNQVIIPADLRDGITDVAPVLPGFIPFGMVYGVAAVNVNMSQIQAVIMSLITFAGTAQVAAIGMIGRDAPVIVIVLTGLLINLRFAMYSASLAPYFRDEPLPWQMMLAFVLATPGYVLATARFTADTSLNKRSYYLGTSVPVWATWQVGTVLGVIAGMRLPSDWQLEFAFPLLFIALLFPLLESIPEALTAAVAGIVAILAEELPLNAGFLLAVLVGVIVGMICDSRLESSDTATDTGR